MTYNIKYIASAGYDFYSTDTTSSGCIGGGRIDIEISWQMLSVPIIHGYWSSIEHKHIHDNATPATIYNYIITQIEDTYGADANTMIEVSNTLIGGQGNYWNFVPGVTNPASPHNFNLAYLDTTIGVYEYTGFFVKSIHSSSFVIQWGDI